MDGHDHRKTWKGGKIDRSEFRQVVFGLVISVDDSNRISDKYGLE